MSSGNRLPWAEAAEIARVVSEEMTPVCARVKTVGSVRRRKPVVGDIEMLLEPRLTQVGLFDTEARPDVESIYRIANTIGTVDNLLSGQRQIHVQHPWGIAIDLFLCHPPASWGVLLALRTGPADLSQHAVTRLHLFDRACRKAHIEEERDGTIAVLETPTEEDFFRVAGLPCVPPQLRHTPQAFRPVDNP